MRNVYKIVVGKPEGKRPPRRHSYKWEDNIGLHLREIRWEGVDGIHLVQETNQ